MNPIIISQPAQSNLFLFSILAIAGGAGAAEVFMAGCSRGVSDVAVWFWIRTEFTISNALLHVGQLIFEPR
jgi:hypothetical protein